jgi:hypothetical protein
MQMTKKVKQQWIIIVTLIVASTTFMYLPSKAQSTKKVSGFLDFNGYYDSRDYTVFTYNILAKLPHRLEYFSLTNYQGSESNSDVNNFYAEHNIRFGLVDSKPLDATMQYVIRSGIKNDKQRLGIRWRIHHTKLLKSAMEKCRFSYSINPMFVEFGVGNMPKFMNTIEHVYNIQLIPNRLYLGGFADQNMISVDSKIIANWVSEHQLGYRLIDQFFAVVEYRINEYERPQSTGLGFGVEYKIVY